MRATLNFPSQLEWNTEFAATREKVQLHVMVIKSLLVLFYCKGELLIFLHIFIYSFTYFRMDLWLPVLFSGF